MFSCVYNLTQDIHEYAELQTKPLQRGPHCPLLRLLVAEVVQEGWKSEVGERHRGPQGARAGLQR